MQFQKLIKHVFSKIDGELEDTSIISGVSTDTREDLNNKLFVPLKGDNFDGHDFLAQAIEKGAVAALWQKDYPRPKSIIKSFPLILVDDTLIGLQTLAKKYLRAVEPKVIAITGSNGKTTTKDLVYSVLRKNFKTHATKGNFNNHIGLPLTILAMPRNTEVIVLEMGMSDFGEIEQLSKIAKPDIAIITNIGESHIEHLGSREAIAKAKLEITAFLDQDGLLIYDGDEPLLNKNYSFEAISVGFNLNNDYQITNYNVSNDRTEFQLNDEQEIIKVPLIGKHQAKNASFSWLVGIRLGMKPNQIEAGLNDLITTGMRFEKIAGKKGSVLINDSYNASPTSMGVAIDVVSEVQGFDTKIIVLGDMLELGDNASDYHRQVGRNIPHSIDYLYTYGEEAKEISKASSVPAKHFASKEDLITILKDKQTESTIILFKASRGMRFEHFIHALKK